MDGLYPKKCEFRNCGKWFEDLHTLILHIEAFHINFWVEPEIVHGYLGQNDDHSPVRGIPLSLVHPYADEETIEKYRDEELKNRTNCVDFMPEAQSKVPSKRKTKSKAYWYGPEMGPKYGSKCDVKYKKFTCPIKECTKSYKNFNGMKYHLVHFHEVQDNFIKHIKEKKEYKCEFCSKEYKTYRGLQSHIQGHQQHQQLQLQPPGENPRSVPSSLMQAHRGRPYFDNMESVDRSHPSQLGPDAYFHDVPPNGLPRYDQEIYMRRMEQVEHRNKVEQDCEDAGEAYIGQFPVKTSESSLEILKQQAAHRKDNISPPFPLIPQGVQNGSNILHTQCRIDEGNGRLRRYQQQYYTDYNLLTTAPQKTSNSSNFQYMKMQQIIKTEVYDGQMTCKEDKGNIDVEYFSMHRSGRKRTSVVLEQVSENYEEH